MPIEIIPVGGHGEVGRNCTAVKVDDEVFILDLGLHLENFVRLQDDERLAYKLSKKLLIKEQAVPDIDILSQYKDRVKGILISHAHLDHVGAVPYLANSFDCDVHGTAFTMEIARRLVIDKKKELKNTLVTHKFGELFPLSENVSVEFVEITHSTPDTAAIVLHTKYGDVLYVNDFKLDPDPLLGNKTDMARFKELDVKVLILDTLYADLDAHTPGEQTALELLEGALLERDFSNKLVLVSTFGSHICRLESIAKVAKKMGRKVVFIGHSMGKYLEAAKDVGISTLVDDHESIKYGGKLRKMLGKVSHPYDYVFVVTGGMGEPTAALTRIVDERLLPLKRNDVIVFSNKIIPVPSIIDARARLEKQLSAKGFELIKDVHVSGHGAAKDHELLLGTINPEFVVPVHGTDSQRAAFLSVAENCGYDEKHILVLDNDERVMLD